jgi:hypothetical protein
MRPRHSHAIHGRFVPTEKTEVQSDNGQFEYLRTDPFWPDDFPAGVAALEHRESVVAVGHVVASLQRGYEHRVAARCWRGQSKGVSPQVLEFACGVFLRKGRGMRPRHSHAIHGRFVPTEKTQVQSDNGQFEYLRTDPFRRGLRKGRGMRPRHSHAIHGRFVPTEKTQVQSDNGQFEYLRTDPFRGPRRRRAGSKAVLSRVKT